MYKCVFVVGGSGFLGSSIIDVFNKNNFKVYNLDLFNSKSNTDYFLECDILDKSKLYTYFRLHRPNIVIVCAARTDISKDSCLRYKTNINGTINLCNSINDCSSVETVIWTSTQLVSVLGKEQTSDYDYFPPNSYGESKAINELIARNFISAKIKNIVLRPTTLWGPGCSNHYLRWYKFINSGYYFHTGKKNFKKSFGFIKNVAYQYLKFAEADFSLVNKKSFYVADYEPINLVDYCNDLSLLLRGKKCFHLSIIICKILSKMGDLLNFFGLNFPYNSFRFKNIVKEYVIDLNATFNVCGKLPYTHQNALEMTVVWVRDKLNIK